MTVAAAVAVPWHRAHIYKALACIVFVLIALQYLLSGAIDRRSSETIFTINTSRPPHQRALVIYGPATTSSNDEEDDESPGVGGPSNPSINLTSPVSTSAAPANVSVMQKANSSSSTTSGTPLQVQQVQNLTVVKSKNATTNVTVAPTIINISHTGTTTSHGITRCPLVPPKLVGPLVVSKSAPDIHAMEKAFAKVKPGGKGSPDDCLARYRVAIVIPFRDRFPHLMTLLYNLHPLLLRQQLDYQIFVVEQEGTWQFNRAMLMNVGYVEALKERPFDCFVFHDVDLLPEDDRNLYTCPEQPRHMSVAVDKFLYRLPYSDLFGGVSAMTTDHFRLVNGFSNVFWGWGGEDDDMANRIKARGLHISRYPANIARYKMLTHKKEKANPKRYEFLKTGKKRFITDGLSNLQYELIDKKKPKLYTRLLVRLTPPNQPS